uniref:Uncharacterized protein n=1 Tax=Cryptomonas curvata TaxID=233186 RepID=A0A7S0QL05_9CRYP
MTSAVSLILGTSGVGKSIFRWYLVWKWMRDDSDIAQFKFEDVRTNMKENFYLVEKDGTARNIPVSSVSSAPTSLALMDPCSIVEDKSFFFKMLVVTSSPSAVVGDAGKPSLTELRKIAFLYVMKWWSVQELKMIKPDVQAKLLERFSTFDGTSTYCVPRWFFYRDEEIQGQLTGCWSNNSREAFRDFFLKESGDLHKHKGLPFRLCAIVENGPNDWKVAGFISDFVAEEVYKWAEVGAYLDRAGFLNLLDHPLGGSLIGCWYERWALECIERQESIVVSNEQLGMSPPRKKQNFVFENLEIFNVDTSRRGKTQLDVKIDSGTLYKPRSKAFPSIDAYGKTAAGDLLFLQFTKALTHSPALWKDISTIARKANSQKDIKRTILIYCCPYVDEFRTPSCPDLKGKNVIVCKGTMQSDFFLHLKQKRKCESAPELDMQRGSQKKKRGCLGRSK